MDNKIFILEYLSGEQRTEPRINKYIKDYQAVFGDNYIIANTTDDVRVFFANLDLRQKVTVQIISHGGEGRIGISLQNSIQYSELFEILNESAKVNLILNLLTVCNSCTDINRLPNNLRKFRILLGSVNESFTLQSLELVFRFYTATENRLYRKTNNYESFINLINEQYDKPLYNVYYS